MRPKIIAGNWKMNNTLPQTHDLINGLKTALTDIPPSIQMIICPPAVALESASKLLQGTAIRLGAQNMHYEEEGAFTGEVSAGMLKSVGCSYVILGHSERRQYFHESDELINRKAKKALASGLLPIICVGETLEQREGGITEKVVATQLRGVLSGIEAKEVAVSIIAYEPVWAIGTGKNATPQQAEDVHRFIRNLITELYSSEVADQVVIQYGGSVKPDNSAVLLSQPNIDGALVGGACLKVDSFAAIIKSAIK